MHPRFLIKIDKSAWPVTRAVEALYQIMPIRIRHRPSGDQKLVLFKFFGMGSIVRLTSILEKNGVDKSQVLVCTLAGNEQLCKLLGYPNIGVIRDSLFGALFDLSRLISRIKSFNPDILLDLERCSNLVSIYRFTASVVSGAYFYGFDNRPKTKIFKNGIVQSIAANSVWHFAEKCLQSMRREPPRSEIWTVEVNRTKILVNLNAGQYLIERRYPSNGFETVIKDLYHWDSNLIFKLTGDGQEIAYVDKSHRSLEALGIPAHNCAGDWSLTDLISELADTALLITNDSGPMHLAAFLGTPTIAIWGPTHFSDLGYKQNNGLVNISLEKDCAPCFLSPKSIVGEACNGSINCMRDLDPQRIVAAAKALLRDQPEFRKVNYPAGTNLISSSTAIMERT